MDRETFETIDPILDDIAEVASELFESAATKKLESLTSPYNALRRVSCECRCGALVLRGHLFSFHETQFAQESVARVNGVIQVVNEIQVEEPGWKQRGTVTNRLMGQEEPCPRKKEQITAAAKNQAPRHPNGGRR